MKSEYGAAPAGQRLGVGPSLGLLQLGELRGQVVLGIAGDLADHGVGRAALVALPTAGQAAWRPAEGGGEAGAAGQLGPQYRGGGVVEPVEVGVHGEVRVRLG